MRCGERWVEVRDGMMTACRTTPIPSLRGRLAGPPSCAWRGVTGTVIDPEAAVTLVGVTDGNRAASSKTDRDVLGHNAEEDIGTSMARKEHLHHSQ